MGWATAGMSSLCVELAAAVSVVLMSSCSGSSGFVLVRVHLFEDCVEAMVALFCLLLVPLDPFRHQIEHIAFEVDRSALGFTGAGDQSGVLEHLEMFRHGLHAHLIGFGEL